MFESGLLNKQKLYLLFFYVVGDSPMTRIIDLPKGYINQELSWRAAAVVSTLPVFVYVEPRKPSSETWIHLCGTSYLCVELFIY